MSDNLGSKDYGDYFARIEKQLESGALSGENKVEAERVCARQNVERETKTAPVLPIERTQKRRRVNYKRVALLVLCAVLVVSVAVLLFNIPSEEQNGGTEDNNASVNIPKPQEQEPEVDLLPTQNAATKNTISNLNSTSAIFVKLSDNSIVAQQNSTERMYPASTTKLMTLLVAVEQIEDLNATFTLTYEMIDPMHEVGATVAGFCSGEVVTMTDLLYGLILPSGGDAAVALCEAVAGGEEEFARLMNEKARSLGLKNTNFVNATGLHHTNHYSTVTDMSVILGEVIKNDMCKRILSTYKFKMNSTNKHPEGLEMTSTLFSYMYGTEPDGAEIIGGKTGYVDQSGYCIASFGKSTETNAEYICVTFNAPSKYPAVYDHFDLFSAFAK